MRRFRPTLRASTGRPTRGDLASLASLILGLLAVLIVIVGLPAVPLLFRRLQRDEAILLHDLVHDLVGDMRISLRHFLPGYQLSQFMHTQPLGAPSIIIIHAHSPNFHNSLSLLQVLRSPTLFQFSSLPLSYSRPGPRGVRDGQDHPRAY